MKRFIYILLAGLATSGLASCNKQDFKPSVSDVYAVEIEEDILQTKASSVEIKEGDEKTFYATLRKSSDGGNTWTHVSHSDWNWGDLSNCTKGTPGTEQGYKEPGVISGKCTYTGKTVSSKDLIVSTQAGGATISKKIPVDVTAKPHTVTFNFNPDIESLVIREFPVSQTQKYINACQGIVIWAPDGTEFGSTAFIDFFSYTGWTLTEVKSQFDQSTKDGRVKTLSLSTKLDKIYVGISSDEFANSSSYVQCFEKNEFGNIKFVKAKEPNAKLSSGSLASPGKYPSGYTSSDFKAVYELTVNSDMSVTVTIGD